ncbi:DUF5681 domain-containing protein [Roseiarcaceae bacterium H3SJ34-1]|uniref:DUF5681 domain-containing protein n=1 Tax=Terripilifer ovatus TaxID=3032367 RepID=UPI003AB9AB50|nr:DUF5681 domain-containing protein [Roseiarcaceae bacterium H3SJ34-1]
MGKHRNRKATSSDHYSVGYGKPPVNERWVPGQSGNPSGKRNRPETPLEMIDETLFDSVGVVINDKTVRMPAFKAMVRRAFALFMGGNIKAGDFIFRLREHFMRNSGTSADLQLLSPEDQKLFDELMKDVRDCSTDPPPASDADDNDEDGKDSDPKPGDPNGEG